MQTLPVSRRSGKYQRKITPFKKTHPTVAAGISQHQLRLMGAQWDHFRNCYRHPRQTVIWKVLTNIDAAELDRITGKWLLAQARKYREEDGGIKWVIAIDGKVMRGAWTQGHS